MQFKPGESGNPKGRPKKAEAMTDILKGELGTLSLIDDEGNAVPAKQAIARKLIDLAMNGDTPALKYIYDRVDGRPKESIDLDHSGNIDITDITAEEREQRIAKLLKETGIICKVKDDPNTD